MSHNLSFARFAWKNMWRRRLRTCLTLCGIGIGIGAFVALVGFSRSFEVAWQKLYESSGTDLAVVQKTFLNTSVDQSAEAKLDRMPFIASAAPMMLNMMDITPEVNALIYGWRTDSFEFEPLKIEGRRFHDGQPELLLGELLANGLHKKPGDMLDIQGTTFRVTGVYQGGSALVAGAVIMPLDQLQKLTGLEGKVTAFHVRLRPGAPGEAAAPHVKRAEAKIEAALPGIRAIPALERASNNELVVLAHAAAWGTSGIALLIAALGIGNTMAMSVFERTKEIGVLRALGWKRWRVMGLILLEAAVLGLSGGLLGVLTGWAALRILAMIPQTANIMPAAVPARMLIDAICMAVFVGLLAGLVPAWRGARLSPVEALRHE